MADPNKNDRNLMERDTQEARSPLMSQEGKIGIGLSSAVARLGMLSRDQGVRG